MGRLGVGGHSSSLTTERVSSVLTSSLHSPEQRMVTLPQGLSPMEGSSNSDWQWPQLPTYRKEVEMGKRCSKDRCVKDILSSCL